MLHLINIISIVITYSQVYGSMFDYRSNEFINHHPHAFLSNTSGWSRLLEETFPHIRNRTLVKKSTGKICAILPLFSVESLIFGKRLVSTPFATLSKPLCYDPCDEKHLMANVLAIAKNEGYKAIEVRTYNNANAAYEGYVSYCSAKHHYIKLNRELVDIYKNIKYKSIRLAIKKAKRSGIQVSEADDKGELSSFYSLYLASRHRLGLPPLPQSFFLNLIKEFGGGNMRITYAEKNGKKIAALCTLYNNRVYLLEFSGENISYRGLNPMHILYWESIQNAHKSGAQILSFGRTDIANEGLRRFKRRWGAEEEDFVTYIHPENKISLREKSLYSFGRRFFRSMPIPIYKILGRAFYRHFG